MRVLLLSLLSMFVCFSVMAKEKESKRKLASPVRALDPSLSGGANSLGDLTGIEDRIKECASRPGALDAFKKLKGKAVRFACGQMDACIQSNEGAFQIERALCNVSTAGGSGLDNQTLVIYRGHSEGACSLTEAPSAKNGIHALAPNSRCE